MKGPPLNKTVSIFSITKGSNKYNRQRGRSHHPPTDLNTTRSSTAHFASLLLSPLHISPLVCRDHVPQPPIILLLGTSVWAALTSPDLAADPGTSAEPRAAAASLWQKEDLQLPTHHCHL